MELVPYYVRIETDFLTRDARFTNGALSYWNPKKRKIGYNPAAVCLMAIASYERYLEGGDSTSMTLFNQQVEWLVENVKISNGMARWVYEDGVDRYRTGEHWISGMAQGLAISVLSRAYWLSSQNAYRELCVQAYRTMTQGVSEGGTVAEVALDDFWFFEEYPNRMFPILVLNGNIFSIFGVHDMMMLVPVCNAAMVFEKAVKTLENVIELYDYKGWSLYDLLVRSGTLNVAPVSYHLLHLRLLEGLRATLQRFAATPRIDRIYSTWRRQLFAKSILFPPLSLGYRLVRGAFATARLKPPWQSRIFKMVDD